MNEDIIGMAMGGLAIVCLLIGMPWLILHYVTKWKQAPKITQADEALLDEMHQLSRRLDERLVTVERLVASDNPDFRPAPQPALTARTDDDYRPARRETYQGDYARTERSN